MVFFLILQLSEVKNFQIKYQICGRVEVLASFVSSFQRCSVLRAS